MRQVLTKSLDSSGGERDFLPRPVWLPHSVWPFATFRLEAGGSALAVTEAGDGPPLLLVHAGAWSFLWRDLMKLLSPDFRCICFDAPGNGRTADPAGFAVSLDRVRRAVLEVADKLGLRDLIIVAHDLGGPASIAASGEIADRVRGIVAMNTFAWRPDHAGLRFMLALMGSAAMRELDALTGFIPKISASGFGVGRRMDEPSRAAFLAGMDARGRRSFHNYLRDARRAHGLYDRCAAALAGPLARKPLLTIFGERNDPFGFQARWKAMFPQARQIVVPAGNHFPMCDAPALVSDAIREWFREIT